MYFFDKNLICIWSDGSLVIKFNFRWVSGMIMFFKSIFLDVVLFLYIFGWWFLFGRQVLVVLKFNVKVGCYVVLKQFDVFFYGVVKFRNSECLLRVLFFLVEFEIFRNMFEDMRKSFVVVKVLLIRVVKVSGKLVDMFVKGLKIQIKFLIFIYLLKNVLFYTLECFLEGSV